jgi:hypothetical protein
LIFNRLLATLLLLVQVSRLGELVRHRWGLVRKGCSVIRLQAKLPRDDLLTVAF